MFTGSVFATLAVLVLCGASGENGMREPSDIQRGRK